jgi:hypothetical protein
VGDLVGPNLRSRGRRLPDQRVLFINGDILCSSVNLARRSVHDSNDSSAPGGLHHVHRSNQVGLHVETWSLVRVRNCNEASDVDDECMADHCRLKRVRFANITKDDPNVFPSLKARVFEPACRSE